MVNPGAKRRANLWERDKVSWPVESLLPGCQGSPPFPDRYETSCCCCHCIDGEVGRHWYMAKLAFKPGLATKILCFSLCLCLPRGAKCVYTGDEVSHRNWGDLGSTFEGQGNLSKWFVLLASFLPWSYEVVMGTATSTMHLSQISPGVFPSGLAWQSITATLLTKKEGAWQTRHSFLKDPSSDPQSHFLGKCKSSLCTQA